jgi:integrase
MGRRRRTHRLGDSLRLPRSPIPAAARHRIIRGPTTARRLIPNPDYHESKALIRAANVRDARLHDARHTAATVLLVLGVSERTVMGIMVWSSTAMAAPFQHVTDPIRRDVAKRVGSLLWDDPDGPAARAL